MSNAELSQQINDAIGAHGMWKLRLRTAITVGKSDITPQVAGCDDQCAFGKWLYSGQINSVTRSGLPYQVVRRLHSEFHQSAGAVLQQAVSGNKGEAEALMLADFTPRSEKLVRALTKWKREIAAVG